MSEILSAVTAKRSLGGESFSVALGAEIPVIIGTSRGASTLISAPEEITHVAQVDTLANSDIRTVLWAADNVDGSGKTYLKDVHFTLQTSGSLDFTNAPTLAPPAVDTVTKALTGGSWSATGKVGWALTCTDKDGNETLIGVAATDTITSTGDAFSILFAKPSGASGAVKVYRTLNFSGSTPIFTTGDVQYFVVSSGNTFNDTGSAGVAAFPPTTTSAKDRPGVGDTYYVNYEYAVFTYLTPTLYATTDAIISDHGIGSALSNAGILAIGRNGKGNEAPAVVLVAVENDEVSDYQAALTTLEAYPYGNYIVCLKQNAILDESGKTHAEYMSQDEIKRERFYLSGAPADAVIGSSATAGSVIHKIASFLGSKRVVVPVLEGSKYILNQWQGTDGTYTYNVELTNSQYFAVAVAARKCAQPDVAEDMTGKQIIGFNIPDTNPHWTTIQKELVVTAGGFLVVDDTTKAVVNRAITCSQASTEDQTFSVLSAEDELRRQVRLAGKPFIGKKLTDNRILSFVSFTKAVLDLFVQRELITTYQDLEGFADPLNSQKLVAKFRYKPMWSAIWIEFNYGFIPS